MQVIRRLKLNAVVSVVTTVIILIVLFLAVYHVNQAMNKLEIADNIMSASFERVALSIDYQRTGNESAKAQYLAKHEQIGRLLRDASRMFEDAEDKETIKKMISSHESIGRIFAAIATNREAKMLGQSHSGFSAEIENGLISQLNMRLYKVVSHVHKLHESSREALFSALRLGGGGLVCLIAILIAASVINSLTMGRTIADRIRRLRDGVSVIGSGSLDYKVDVKGDDEFTELSWAFNEMTIKLREVHDDLKGEINERKKAEEEINRLNDDLLAKNEKLEFANKELESFVYSVSHDLRAPLRHISGFSDLVMKGTADKLDEKGKRYLSRIHDGAERMSRLIDDLLNISRISRQEIQWKEVNMSAKAASIVTELRDAHPSRSVDVDIKGDLIVFADPGLIEVLLSNLLCNAWKFTTKTEDSRIELGTVDREGKIIYYVRDNGAGFDQQYAGKMFWPFHRLHSEAAFEGTGIGLAIVDRIIRLHGGKVWAEGIEGKGATVYFSLS